MKKSSFLSFLAAGLLLMGSVYLTGCTPESGDPGSQGEQGAVGPQGLAGPQGPAGPAGPQGATGQTGNANVIQITYGAQSWPNSANATVMLNLTGVNADLANKSAYFTYINYANLWYSVPGEVNTFGEFRTYMTPSSVSRVHIKRVSTGSTLNASGVRIVIIPASDLRNGRKGAVNYADYNAVKEFYNLPD